MPYLAVRRWPDRDELVADGEVTLDFREARRFGGKLSAETALVNLKLSKLEWLVIREEEYSPRPPPIDLADLPLAVRDPVAAVRMVAAAHDEYCGRIEAWLTRAGVPHDKRGRPKCEVVARCAEWAGLYQGAEHACAYPLAYAMMHGERFAAEVCAHEACHGYQHALTGRGTGHGNDFFALAKHAAREPAVQKHHQFDVTVAREVTRALLPWWREWQGAGLLVSLPCEVQVDKRVRRGLR